VAEHSKFSASAAERWLACPGSIPLSAGKPDSTSVYAARGTVAHTLLEWSLKQGLTKPHAEWLGAVHEVDGHEIEVDQDLLDNVEWALGHIGETTAGCDIVMSETRVNYADWLGVPEADAFGTSDIIAVRSDQRELIVADYKNGRKPVLAIDNPQMMLYAAGALAQVEDIVDVDSVRTVILQPEALAPKEHVISVADLKAWLRGRARSGATSVQQAERMYADAADGALTGEWVDTFLHPGDHCQWCKAKATCPKLREAVTETVFDTAPATPDEFENLSGPPRPDGAVTDWLAVAFSKLDLIEEWVEAVRKEVARRLAAGEPVPGYKLVPGKKGARQWADKAAAEDLLRKQFRLPIEKAYDLKLISPTSAEKLVKAGDIGERQWKKAAALITQSEGRPHVAPESDPRSAITVQPVAEMFEPQAGEMV
jgi:hypothetical protein